MVQTNPHSDAAQISRVPQKRHIFENPPPSVPCTTQSGFDSATRWVGVPFSHCAAQRSQKRCTTQQELDPRAAVVCVCAAPLTKAPAHVHVLTRCPAEPASRSLATTSDLRGLPNQRGLIGSSLANAPECRCSAHTKEHLPAGDPCGEWSDTGPTRIAVET